MDFIARAKQLARQQRYRVLRQVASGKRRSTLSGRKLFARIFADPNAHRRVINLMSGDRHSVYWLGTVVNTKRAQEHLELCIMHALMGGDFYEYVVGPAPRPALVTAKRAMKKLVKRGDIIAAYCDGTLDDLLEAWREKRRKPVKILFAW